MYILLLVILIFSFLIISTLSGRYVTQKHELFLNNFFVEWIIGIISYLLLTFIIWVPLMLVRVENYLWFLIILFIKDGLIGLFFFKTKYLNIKMLNWKDLIWTIMAGITIFLIVHFGIQKIFHYTQLYNNKKLSKTWNIVNQDWNVFHYLYNAVFLKLEWKSNNTTNLYNGFAHIMIDIVLGGLFYSIITSFFINSLYGHGISERIISFVITIAIIFLISIGRNQNILIGDIPMFLALFLVLIGLRLIKFSRRRYGTLYGIVAFIAWTINYNIIWTLIAISSIIIIIYTFQKKPKPSLFFVQLIAPLTIFLLMNIYSINRGKEKLQIIYLFVGIIIALIYLIIIFSSNEFMNKLNILLTKHRVIVPIILITSFLTTVIVFGVISKTHWHILQTLKSPLTNIAYSFNATNTYQVKLIEMSFFYSIIGTSFIFWIYMWWKNKNINNDNWIFIFLPLLFIIMFNPIVERGLNEISNRTHLNIQGFYYIKTLFIPIILLTTTSKFIRIIKTR